MTDIYRVTAPYITLKSRAETGAEVVLGYYKDALVPETVDLEDLAKHIRKGMVEKVEGAEAKAVRQQQAEAEKAKEDTAAVVDTDGEAAVKKAEDDRAAADKAAKADKTEPKAAESKSPATSKPPTATTSG